MLTEREDLWPTVKFACLDSQIPEGHLLRKIEKIIDFSRIYELVKPFAVKIMDVQP